MKSPWRCCAITYQYAYYAMVRHDERQRFWSPAMARVKAIFALIVVETWILGTCYVFVAHALGARIGIYRSWGAMLAYAIVIFYGNAKLLEPEPRVVQHKKLFDAWSQRKRWLMNAYEIVIGVFACALFLWSVSLARK